MSDLRSAADNRPAESAAADPVHGSNLVELGAYRDAQAASDWDAAWRHLERGHIVAQSRFALHLSSHVEMLKFAFSRRDAREVTGQLLRLLLVPLGALTGRLPMGNIGRARVSAFAPMPVPEDLRPYVPKDAS